jgi:tRNA (Thr-GGU) A37 N-methylase
MSHNQNLRRRSWELAVTDQSKVHPPIVDFKSYIKKIDSENLTKDEQAVKIKIQYGLDTAIQPFSQSDGLVQG